MLTNKSLTAKEVVKPTYIADIGHFFSAGDKARMVGMEIDLATYEGGEFNA